MISEVKQVIVNQLKEIYPTGYAIYDEALPETKSTPAFLVQIAGESCSRRVNHRYSHELSFEVTYYSNEAAVRADCISVQERLLRAFDVIGTFKVRNKKSKITDNVLHFTFDIRYCEIMSEDAAFMQKQQINTNI